VAALSVQGLPLRRGQPRRSETCGSGRSPSFSRAERCSSKPAMRHCVATYTERLPPPTDSIWSRNQRCGSPMVRAPGRRLGNNLDGQVEEVERGSCTMQPGLAVIGMFNRTPRFLRLCRVQKAGQGCPSADVSRGRVTWTCGGCRTVSGLGACREVAARGAPGAVDRPGHEGEQRSFDRPVSRMTHRMGGGALASPGSDESQAVSDVYQLFPHLGRRRKASLL